MSEITKTNLLYEQYYLNGIDNFNVSYLQVLEPHERCDSVCKGKYGIAIANEEV